MEVLQDTYKDTKIGRIPKDWDCKQMNDFVVNFRGGASFKPNEFSNEGVKVLSKIGVRSSGVMTIPFSKQQFCEEICLEKYAKSVVSKSELVTVLRDLVPSGPSIGYIVKIPDNSAYIMAQGVYCFSVDENKINQNFLIQLSNTNWYRKYMQKILVGSTQVHIRGPVFLKTPLPLPSLPEQQKIAAILSTVDEQISTTDKIIEKSKELKKGLMQQLFSEGIGHTEFKDTKVGRIPKDWEFLKIGDFSNVQRGASPRPIKDVRYFSDKGRGWIRIADVSKSYKYLTKTTQYLSELGSSKSRIVNEGDIIMSICGSIGKPIIIGIPSCIHDGFVLFSKFQHKMLPEYLYYFLYFMEKYYIGKGQEGTQKNLNTSIVKSTKLGLPPLPEQKKIATILSEADAKIEKEQEQKAQLEQLKKGLMQQLLTGKKRVKV